MRQNSIENLRSRIEYFLSSHRKDRPEVGQFISDVAAFGDPLIFGGMLRDLAVDGNRNFYSDVDIVISGAKGNSLTEFMQSLGSVRNSFGGFRLNLGHWPIDIWRLEDTWAFKQGLVAFEGPESLLKTTFFNWDAVYYECISRQIFHCDRYFEDLENRILNVNLAENPNPRGVLKRILSFLNEYDAKLTRELCEYVAVVGRSAPNLLNEMDSESKNIVNQISYFLENSDLEYFSLQSTFKGLDNEISFF